jgi:hypothetical protein
MNQLADNEIHELENPGSFGQALGVFLLFVGIVGSWVVNYQQWQRIKAIEERLEEDDRAQQCVEFEWMGPMHGHRVDCDRLFIPEAGDAL